MLPPLPKTVASAGGSLFWLSSSKDASASFRKKRKKRCLSWKPQPWSWRPRSSPSLLAQLRDLLPPTPLLVCCSVCSFVCLFETDLLRSQAHLELPILLPLVLRVRMIGIYHEAHLYWVIVLFETVSSE